MPVRPPSTADVPENHREHLLAEQRYQPMHRASEVLLDVSPAHRLLEADPVHRTGEYFRQHGQSRAPLLLDRGGDVFALRGLNPPKPLQRNFHSQCKPLRRLGGLALPIIGGFGRRPDHLAGAVGAGFRHPLN